jgi:hypothetical protein
MRRVSPIVFSSRHSAMRPMIARLLLKEMAFSMSLGENRKDFRSYFGLASMKTPYNTHTTTAGQARPG